MDGFGFAASGTPTTATPAGSETVSGSPYSPALVVLGMIVAVSSIRIATPSLNVS